MRVYLSKYQMGFALNEQEASVYVALKIMYDRMLVENRYEVLVYTNLQSIYYELAGNFEIPRKTIALLQQGLQGLIDAKVVKVKDNDNKGNYILDLFNLKIQDGEPYTVMEVNEIRKVFTLNHKNKLNLLRFLVALFGTIKYNTSCGFASFKYLEEISNISMSSCKSMFKLLEENEIIYVRHCQNAKRDINGQIKTLSNVYGRPRHKEEINEFFSNRSKQEGYNFTNKMSTNRKGQTTRLYNKFIDGKYNCTESELKHLIKECLIYNQQYFIKDEPKSQKDMSVFPYDLVEECKKEMPIHIKEEKKKEKEKRKFGTKETLTSISPHKQELLGRMIEINKKIEENSKKYTDKDYWDEYDEDDLF